jgi:glucuronate isomerase
MEINDLTSLKTAVAKRLEFFKRLSCCFSDVGIPYFPDSIADEPDADRIFHAVLAGKEITEKEYLAFLGNMYVFLGNLYRDNNIVMQWHLAVARNVNSRLYAEKGVDSGGDCIGNAIPIRNLLRLLDSINNSGGLPKTILYTLNPTMLESLTAAAGCFRNVSIGAAWWFNDHIRGIEQTLETIAHSGYICSFIGMVTDSRSFLSYTRHDYFRASFAPSWENGWKAKNSAATPRSCAEKSVVTISKSLLKECVKMVLGAQLYTLRELDKTPEMLAQTLARVAEIGYKSVQVSGTCSYEAEWLNEQLKKNGLVCALTHFNPDRIKDNPDETVAFHNRFGCKNIGIGSVPAD